MVILGQTSDIAQKMRNIIPHLLISMSWWIENLLFNFYVGKTRGLIWLKLGSILIFQRGIFCENFNNRHVEGKTVPMSMHFSIFDSIVSEAASVSLEFIFTFVFRLRLYLMLGFNNGYKLGSVNESKHK